MSTILISGATGQLGQIVIENLLKSVPSTNITALVRDESKAEDLKAKGINLKVGNYQQHGLFHYVEDEFLTDDIITKLRNL
jgi:NAD(P)H dehydrogenase (quinone)